MPSARTSTTSGRAGACARASRAIASASATRIAPRTYCVRTAMALRKAVAPLSEYAGSPGGGLATLRSHCPELRSITSVREPPRVSSVIVRWSTGELPPSMSRDAKRSPGIASCALMSRNVRRLKSAAGTLLTISADVVCAESTGTLICTCPAPVNRKTVPPSPVASNTSETKGRNNALVTSTAPEGSSTTRSVRSPVVGPLMPVPLNPGLLRSVPQLTSAITRMGTRATRIATSSSLACAVQHQRVIDDRDRGRHGDERDQPAHGLRCNRECEDGRELQDRHDLAGHAGLEGPGIEPRQSPRDDESDRGREVAREDHEVRARRESFRRQERAQCREHERLVSDRVQQRATSGRSMKVACEPSIDKVTRRCHAEDRQPLRGGVREQKQNGQWKPRQRDEVREAETRWETHASKLTQRGMRQRCRATPNRRAGLALGVRMGEAHQLTCWQARPGARETSAILVTPSVNLRLTGAELLVAAVLLIARATGAR